MNELYIIKDKRTIDHFKEETFSGFKKRDVFSELFKSIESGKIENACFWITECIISGYILQLFEKIIIFSSKIIHINNPTLPQFLLTKYVTFQSSTNHITKKEDFLHLRNTQSIRNLCFDLVTTLCTSSKQKRYDKYPKIKPDTDFNFSILKTKLIATLHCIPSHILRFTDPEELRIVINELIYNLKNNMGSYNRVCYWIAWIFEWEKKQKKQNGSWEIEERDIQDIPGKYKKDVVWLIWETILEEANSRDEMTKLQILSLYKLFKLNYTSGKRNSRIPIIYHVIGYLTHIINFKQVPRNNKDLFIQSQCNVNLMFQSKKINEKNNDIIPIMKKKTPPKQNIVKEKCSDRLNLLNDLDNILFNK